MEKIESKGLILPANISLVEYLNFGSRSVVNASDRQLLLSDWEQLTREEKQRNLNVIHAFQPYRTHLGISIFPTCGYRSERHELTKGRSGKSQHLLGAFDFTCNSKQELKRYADLLKDTWYGGFKYYENKNFIHLDLGENRRW